MPRLHLYFAAGFRKSYWGGCIQAAIPWASTIDSNQYSRNQYFSVSKNSDFCIDFAIDLGIDSETAKFDQI